jgi:uncharacterized protein YdeI (YjbR/CyaY-like superfamily)
LNKSNSEPKVPADLRKVLVTNPTAREKWGDLTAIARTDFIRWIDSAKQAETRRRRIERVPSMLASGKRRPCCFAVVPFDLYKALAAMPTAKKKWRTLTPTARRDLILWIESAKERETRKGRVEEACVRLAADKKYEI